MRRNKHVKRYVRKYENGWFWRRWGYGIASFFCMAVVLYIVIRNSDSGTDQSVSVSLITLLGTLLTGYAVTATMDDRNVVHRLGERAFHERHEEDDSQPTFPGDDDTDETDADTSTADNPPDDFGDNAKGSKSDD